MIFKYTSLLHNLCEMKAGLTLSAVLLIFVRRVHGAYHDADANGNQVSSWILNQPLAFQSHQVMGVIDARSDSLVMTQTEAIIDLYRKDHVRGGDGGTDNEIVDAIGTFKMRYFSTISLDFLTSFFGITEHFFYGMVNGTAMELGGLDGKIRSMTRDLEETLTWRRIIVEGICRLPPLHYCPCNYFPFRESAL